MFFMFFTFLSTCNEYDYYADTCFSVQINMMRMFLSRYRF